MYSIADFEEYTLRKRLSTEPTLVWSKKNGYHFLTFMDRMLAMANGESLKIIGIRETAQ